VGRGAKSINMEDRNVEEMNRESMDVIILKENGNHQDRMISALL